MPKANLAIHHAPMLRLVFGIRRLATTRISACGEFFVVGLAEVWLEANPGEVVLCFNPIRIAIPDTRRRITDLCNLSVCWQKLTNLRSPTPQRA